MLRVAIPFISVFLCISMCMVLVFLSPHWVESECLYTDPDYYTTRECYTESRDCTSCDEYKQNTEFYGSANCCDKCLTITCFTRYIGTISLVSKNCTHKIDVEYTLDSVTVLEEASKYDNITMTCWVKDCEIRFQEPSEYRLLLIIFSLILFCGLIVYKGLNSTHNE